MTEREQSTRARRSSGFTLIETVVMTAVIAIGALAISDLFVNLRLQQDTVEKKADLESISMLVQEVLGHPGFCTANLGTAVSGTRLRARLAAQTLPDGTERLEFEKLSGNQESLISAVLIPSVLPNGGLTSNRRAWNSLVRLGQVQRGLRIMKLSLSAVNDLGVGPLLPNPTSGRPPWATRRLALQLDIVGQLLGRGGAPRLYSKRVSLLATTSPPDFRLVARRLDSEAQRAAKIQSLEIHDCSVSSNGRTLSGALSLSCDRGYLVAIENGRAVCSVPSLGPSLEPLPSPSPSPSAMAPPSWVCPEGQVLQRVSEGRAVCVAIPTPSPAPSPTVEVQPRQVCAALGGTYREGATPPCTLPRQESCVFRRGEPSLRDKVLWCPAEFPQIARCGVVDDSAPSGATPTDLGSNCQVDGDCDASASRVGLGPDLVYLETVRSGNQREGCWAYDPSHSHRAYRLEIRCCR